MSLVAAMPRCVLCGILQKLVQQDPSNGHWEANLARAYLRPGEAFRLKLQPVEARAALVRAQELLTPLQNEHQLSAEAQTWLDERRSN